MKQIVIIVGTDGEVTIEAKNYHGKECDEATKPFEAAIGNIEHKKRKSSYYAAKQTNMVNHEGSHGY